MASRIAHPSRRAGAQATKGPVRMSRWPQLNLEAHDDVVAIEAPLAVHLGNARVAGLMRTPGHDEELALGFLLTEGLIASYDEVAAVQHSGAPGGANDENLVHVHLSDAGPRGALAGPLWRNLEVSGDDGVTGRASIEAAMRSAPPISEAPGVPLERLYRWPGRLREQQPAFDATGGLHAAGLFDRLDRHPALVREDVSRHNAVAKVLGAMLLQRRAAADCALVVSGRVNFELVQKAAVARIPTLAGVAAPTTLAIEAGSALGITVIGFLRGQRMQVYTHPERIEPERVEPTR